jgi:branched-chain amino acid transport system ATP-binding protein
MLALHHIGVRFGGLTALDDVSLRVDRGRTVGVIGPNGAGKTTLFNVICGNVAPTSGALTLDDQPFRPRPDRLTRHGVARTLQGVGLFPGLTVLENVLTGAGHTAQTGFAAALIGLPRARRDEGRLRAAAYAALERCGVAEHARARPQSLPYALRKRVALARELVGEPRLLLLDEPAGGLGPEEIAGLAELITGTEAAVLLVEHHMELVMTVCDEILVLDFGKPIAFGTPGEIRNDPAVAEAYLGVAP